MLSLTIRKSTWICSKMYTRCLRNGKRLGPSRGNPGIDNRISAFTEEGLSIEDHEIEQFLEGSESDFNSAGSSFVEHVKEQKANKDQLRRYIVKEKYFKDSMPNLLTWSEKEQIRHLAATNPKEWTPEKIAESFPVTVPIVKKLLKYAWKPASDKRIARHDATVMRNWRELKDGLLDIPEELRQHMLKFSNRLIPPLKASSFKWDVTQDKNIGEFEEIVQRCAAKSTAQKAAEENPSNHTEYETNKNNNERKDKKLMTLDQLTTNIRKRLEQGKDVNLPEKVLVETIDSNVANDSQDFSGNIILKEDSPKEVSPHKPDEKKILPIDYPERIRIPKQAYKKGATYKVNDCFYDHDGKFLYRVLGLKN